MSEHKAPAVTVLMSCYNGQRWLDEAIESVLRQTFDDFEFIIVDDGSSDASPEIIAHQAARDPRIVVITKPNSGLADSLNVGLRDARGEWIARIDADDVCEPQRLERQLALAATDSEIVFVGSSLVEIDDCSNPVATYRYPTDHRSLLANLSALRRFPPHSSALFRASTARSVGGYRVRLKRSQDSDLWLRLSERGLLVAIDEPLVRVRKHDAQISHDESGRRQRVDARIAITSYEIRRLGGGDPVGGTENEFIAFRAWVDGRMEASGHLDFLRFVAAMRERVRAADGAPARAMALVCEALRHPAMTVRLIRSRLVGDSLSQSLAREWVEAHGANRAS